MQSQKSMKVIPVVFDSKLKIGQLSSSDKETVMRMQANGVISMETARVLCEIEDPGLEEELIQREREKENLQKPIPLVPPLTQLPERIPTPEPIPSN